MNDRSGTVAHDAQHHDDGSLIGGAFSSDGPVSGGGSVDLSGADGDQVLVSSAAEAGLQPSHWSLELWEKIYSPPSGSANLVRARAYGWELAMGTDGGLGVGVDTSNSTSVSVQGGPKVADGSWHYVAVTFDGGSLGLFIDGVQVGTTSTGGASTYYCCDDEDMIGADTPGTYTHRGSTHSRGASRGGVLQLRLVGAAGGRALRGGWPGSVDDISGRAQGVDSVRAGRRPQAALPRQLSGRAAVRGGRRNCYSPSFFAQFATTVLSTYHGDGHSPYGGSYRVLAVAQFNWKGHSITNFQKPAALGYPIYGQTRRLLDYFGPDGHHQCVAAQPPPAGWPGPSRIVEGSVG